ncbi:MAG: YqaA family protein [Flavobacterium sp.]|jgi:membrane protein YqaA with SNARE-associated domain
MEIEKAKKKRTIHHVHKYYKLTGFYDFILTGVKKSILPLFIVVTILMIINYRFINLNELIENLTKNMNTSSIFIFFFFSETILGLIPPDIFIAWSKTTSTPLINLSILATISYCGGITAYFLGKSLLKFEKIKEYVEVKFKIHIKNINKWGGWLIAVGALLPLPFSISTLVAGMVSYNLRNTILFALLRFLRFVIYGAVIYNVL